MSKSQVDIRKIHIGESFRLAQRSTSRGCCAIMCTAFWPFVFMFLLWCGFFYFSFTTVFIQGIAAIETTNIADAQIKYADLITTDPIVTRIMPVEIVGTVTVVFIVAAICIVLMHLLSASFSTFATIKALDLLDEPEKPPLCSYCGATWRAVPKVWVVELPGLFFNTAARMAIAVFLIFLIDPVDPDATMIWEMLFTIRKYAVIVLNLLGFDFADNDAGAEGDGIKYLIYFFGARLLCAVINSIYQFSSSFCKLHLIDTKGKSSIRNAFNVGCSAMCSPSNGANWCRLVFISIIIAAIRIGSFFFLPILLWWMWPFCISIYAAAYRTAFPKPEGLIKSSRIVPGGSLDITSSSRKDDVEMQVTRTAALHGMGEDSLVPMANIPTESLAKITNPVASDLIADLIAFSGEEAVENHPTHDTSSKHDKKVITDDSDGIDPDHSTNIQVEPAITGTTAEVVDDQDVVLVGGFENDDSSEGSFIV
ncbi:hypothetical protein ADUPG1_013282 [Aduncisulcus paluster]|uniref:Transmembrane protein n=1 Tax=Aduncisulcus paluster TaxID=2918883 RepID=A0ABQ5K2E2_9EUKA|nr:hypothetical protein ADUPG1_013282 [Aduncisulcus paluster]|eukprot:gnl/Carplike_NY0171/1851_a2512_941.p1 GENE.gnl/Carplike_NY0171/1851_a2512_941~~gnl/Carplike_NY0171/1851_a2512_941.p1  ORF type:complete len:480 (+),score=106.54 gnl/Carplike_NY0171/1851_a2512_941:32-1471(+)